MLNAVPDELPAAARLALQHRLFEDAADPGNWRVRYMWAAAEVNPEAFAVVLAAGSATRAFTVGREGENWAVYEVEV